MQSGEGHTASPQRQTVSRFQMPPETTLHKQSRPVKKQTFNQQRRDSFDIQALLHAAVQRIKTSVSTRAAAAVRLLCTSACGRSATACV